MPAHTPDRQLPYPLPEDPVVDYPALGRELAETLEALGAKFTRTVLWAAGAGVYNPPAGCRALLVQAIGAGGATAAAAINPTNCGGSGGGGGGAYAERLIAGPLAASYPYGVGTGGAAGNNAGTATYFGPVGAELVKAAGGAGAGAVASSAFNRYAGAAGGKASASIGDFTLDGGDGGTFVILNNSQCIPAYGGAAARGGGSVRPGFAGAVSNAMPGNAPGGGAAGSSVLGSGTSQGAAGANGLLVITELY